MAQPRYKRSERIAAMTSILTNHPNRQFGLGTFSQQLDALKSALSEDLGVVKRTLESLGIGRRLSVAVVAMMLFLVPYFGLGLVSAFYPGTMVSDMFGSFQVNVIWILVIFPLGWITALVYNRIAETYD